MTSTKEWETILPSNYLVHNILKTDIFTISCSDRTIIAEVSTKSTHRIFSRFFLLTDKLYDELPEEYIDEDESQDEDERDEEDDEKDWAFSIDITDKDVERTFLVLVDVKKKTLDDSLLMNTIAHSFNLDHRKLSLMGKKVSENDFLLVFKKKDGYIFFPFGMYDKNSSSTTDLWTNKYGYKPPSMELNLFSLENCPAICDVSSPGLDSIPLATDQFTFQLDIAKGMFGKYCGRYALYAKGGFFKIQNTYKIMNNKLYLVLYSPTTHKLLPDSDYTHIVKELRVVVVRCSDRCRTLLPSSVVINSLNSDPILIPCQDFGPKFEIIVEYEGSSTHMGTFAWESSFEKNPDLVYENTTTQTKRKSNEILHPNKKPKSSIQSDFLNWLISDDCPFNEAQYSMREWCKEICSMTCCHWDVFEIMKQILVIGSNECIETDNVQFSLKKFTKKLAMNYAKSTEKEVPTMLLQYFSFGEESEINPLLHDLLFLESICDDHSQFVFYFLINILREDYSLHSNGIHIIKDYLDETLSPFDFKSRLADLLIITEKYETFMEKKDACLDLLNIT